MGSTLTPSYSKVAIILHWLIALLIIGQLIGGKVMMAMDPNALKFELFQLHKSFGILILILSVLRLLWRLTHKAPPLPEGMKPYERFGAKFSHWGFYVLMIGTPLAGWLMVSANPTIITTKLFKLVKWPDVPGIARSEALKDLMSQTHEYMAYAIIALLILHVGAALKHHFINQDDVLTRMLPFLKRKT